MQLAQVKHNNVTTNATKQQSFSVAQTAEMFSLLSANVYTDPVKAVIREIICNAMDAHTKAGKADEPVEVHLPTSYEPWFSVKDNGPGMSDDDVYNIFCVYGASTKTDNNNETGGFGIGAKAPFAVTDQFTVNVRYNGKYTIYSAYKGDNGVPQMSILSVSDTDECNGVEVHVPIGDHRDHTFKYKYIACASAFKVQPKLNTPIDNDQHYCEFDLGDGVVGKVNLNAPIYDKSIYTIHMGNVEYTGNIPFSVCAAYIFDVPVGTFMPSANRENLQTKDLDIIKTYAEKLQAQIEPHLEAQIAKASSIVEATKFIINSPADRLLFDSVDDEYRPWFKGKQITDLNYLEFKMGDIKSRMDEAVWQQYEQSALTGDRQTMMEFKATTGEWRSDWSFAKPKHIFDHEASVTLSASQLVQSRERNVVFHYEYDRKHILIKNHDMATQNRRGLYQRIKYFLSTEYPGSDHNLYRDFKVHYMDGSIDLNRNKNFYEYIYPVVKDIFEKVIDFKDLPEVPKEVKVREARVARKLKPYGVNLTHRFYGSTTEYLDDITVRHSEVEIDLEDGGYYIPVTRRQISEADMAKIKLGMSLKASNQRCGSNMAEKMRTLVAVPKTILKEFEDHPKWFNYADKCEKEYHLALGKIGMQPALLDSLKQNAYLYHDTLGDCLWGDPLGVNTLSSLINNLGVIDLVPMVSAVLKDAGVIDDFEKAFDRYTKTTKKLQELLSSNAFSNAVAYGSGLITQDVTKAFHKRIGYVKMDRYKLRDETRRATKKFARTRPGLADVISGHSDYDEKSVIAYAKALDIPLKKDYNSDTTTDGKD